MIKKRKSDVGLEELHEVKGAGFTATKKVKRGITVNRRAGLHDKVKYLEGEVRVKRRKPLGLKHVRRMRKFAAVASVGVVGAIAVVGVGFFAPKTTAELNEDFYTVCYEAPRDGTKPTEHSLLENVGYMNYVLQNQEYWSSEMFSTVVSLGFSQTVETYKQYYDDVLISADVAKGFSSKATQFCVANGIVMWRPSANKNFDKMNTPWATGDAQAMTISTFKMNRGFPPSEFSVYVLNEQTIANATDYSVIDNGDGTYSMTLNLNVNTGVDETSADYYYKLQMKVTGDLYDYPSIHSTSVTYVFDENWRVLEFEISDSYNAPVAANFAPGCTSNTKVKFDYGEENAINTFWKDYFSSEYDRVKDTLVDGEKVEENTDNAMGYLSGAFSSVLTEGAIFKVNLGIDDLNLNGVVSVEMENSQFSGLSAKLGDILVWLDGSVLYINDGVSKYKLNTDGLLSSEEEGDGPLGGFDIAALMDQMTEGTFTLDEETNVATLVSEVELFGLKIPMEFEFTKTENGAELNFLKAEIPLGDKVVKASLCFGTESDKPAIPEDTSDYQDILNDGITLDVSLNAKGFTLDGVAKIIMQNGKFAGVCANLGDITVYYGCPPNMLYLSVCNVKYKLDISKLNIGENNLSADLGSFDIKSLLNDVLANLYTSETSLGTSLNINIDSLEKALKVALDIQLFGGLKVEAGLTVGELDVSLSAALSNKEVVIPELTDYQDILNGEITFDVSLTLITGLADENDNRDEVTLKGQVALCLEGGALTEIRADFGGIAVYFDFASNSLYVKVGTTKVMLNLDEMDLTDLSVLSALDGGEFETGELPTAIKEFLTNLTGDGKIISANANLSLLNALIPVWAELDLTDGLSVRARLSLLGVEAVAKVGLSEVALDGLSDEEKEEYVDVLKEGHKIIESLIGGHISATVEGTLYSYNEKYAEYENAKYAFTASLEYDKGAVTVDEEGVEVDSKAYVHLYIGLTANHPDDDSLYIDIVLMDANPVTGADGKTTGGYTTDGKFDIYLSVSNRLDNPVPLNIYAPVDEILTLVSMVGAMANLDGINVENSQELTAAISKISEVLDGMLISKYLPKSVQDKFASLGDSLIPQILGVSLEELLNNLFGNIDDTVKEAEETNFLLSDHYVSSIRTTDESLIFVLNSSLIYNSDIDAEDNLVVTFDRVLRDGVYFVGGISLENIFFGENLSNRLNLGLTLNYDEIVRPDAGNAFAGYLNADGLDTLVNGLINSATHKVEGTEDEYDLNHYYLLQGNVNAGISVIGININVVIQIKSLAVYIDENNEVAIDAHIYYDGVQELNQIAINGDTDVYISVRNGRINIKRIQYTHWEKGVIITKEVENNPAAVEIRAMSLKEFSANMMDNIIFIFNFGPVIVDNLPTEGSSENSGVSFQGLDYGECLNTVISSYLFEETSTGASWTVALQGGLIQAYTGMTTTNIPVKFSADLNEDGSYTVKSLDILKTTMQLFGSAVTLNVTGGLTYCNPNEQMGAGFVDTSKNLFALKADIYSEYGLGEDYVLTDGLYRAQIVDECGAQIKLPIGVTASKNGQLYMLDGYYLNDGNTYCQLAAVEEDGVWYGLTELTDDIKLTAVWNKVYTVSFTGVDGDTLYSVIYHENEVLSAENMPAVPELEGFTGEWSGANGAVIDGNYSFTLKYSPVKYKVTFVEGEQSTVIERPYGSVIGLDELETNTYLAEYIYDAAGNRFDTVTVTGEETYSVSRAGKTFSVAYESDIAFDGSALDTTMRFGDGSDYLSAVASSEYTFLGWFIQNGDGYKYIADANALKDYLSGSYVVDGSTVTLWAVWYSSTVTGEVYGDSYYKYNNLFSKTWYVKGKIDLPFSGKSLEIYQNTSDLKLTMQIKYGISKNGVSMGNDLNNNKYEDIYADGSFEKTVSSTHGNDKGKYSGGDVKVVITLNGKSTTLTSSVWGEYKVL